MWGGPRDALEGGEVPPWGRFRTAWAQRAHSGNYYGDYPGNNPENHPPCGIMHNQFKTQKFKHLMLAMGPRDLNSAPYSPVQCSSHSMTSFQSSELTEPPVVENGHRLGTSVCRLRHDQMDQGPAEPHAGRSTFLLSSGGRGGEHY